MIHPENTTFHEPVADLLTEYFGQFSYLLSLCRPLGLGPPVLLLRPDEAGRQGLHLGAAGGGHGLAGAGGFLRLKAATPGRHHRVSDLGKFIWLLMIQVVFCDNERIVITG